MIFAVARLLLLLVAVLQVVHIDGVSAAQHDANRWRSQGDQAADNGKLLFAHVVSVMAMAVNTASERKKKRERAHILSVWVCEYDQTFTFVWLF